MSTNNEMAAGNRTPAPGAKKVRKGPRVLGTIIIVLVVIAGACYGASWWIDSVAYVSTDDAAIDGRQVKLSSRIMGRISTIMAVEGDTVAEGQVLAVLEDKDLRAQEAQAVASLNYAKQNLSLARVNLDKSQDDADRMSRLYAAGATTRENNEHAQSALQVAKAQYTLSDASVETSTAQIGVLETQILNVSVSTPIDGTVEKVTLNPGDVVQPGQTILSVNNLRTLWVIANFEETKIGRIRSGAPVTITVDAYSGRKFEGKVDMIRAGIVPSAFQIGEFSKTTQRVPVKISFTSPLDGIVLLPGMSVEVKVRTPAELPEFALRFHL
jgi:RND family efflux transporter MFP subunit